MRKNNWDPDVRKHTNMLIGLKTKERAKKKKQDSESFDEKFKQHCHNIRSKVRIGKHRVKSIPPDRQCAMCGSPTTYIHHKHKNGTTYHYPYWHKFIDENEFICHNCYCRIRVLKKKKDVK